MPRGQLGQQRQQPGKRRSGFGAVIPVGRVQRLPGRLVISVAQVMQRRMHRPPQAAGAMVAVLAKDREQRHRQQAHAVFILRVRLRRAHCAQGRQPCGKQVCIARRPALERGTAAHPPAADLQQARRDREAPGPVQRPDVGHRAQPRRHVHADSAPAAGTSALRSTCPAVTGRRPVPIQRASVTARPTTTLSRASRAASRSSSPETAMSTLGPYCRPEAVVGNELLCPRLNCGQCAVAGRLQ